MTRTFTRLFLGFCGLGVASLVYAQHEPPARDARPLKPILANPSRPSPKGKGKKAVAFAGAPTSRTPNVHGARKNGGGQHIEPTGVGEADGSAEARAYRDTKTLIPGEIKSFADQESQNKKDGGAGKREIISHPSEVGRYADETDGRPQTAESVANGRKNSRGPRGNPEQRQEELSLHNAQAAADRVASPATSHEEAISGRKRVRTLDEQMRALDTPPGTAKHDVFRDTVRVPPAAATQAQPPKSSTEVDSLARHFFKKADGQIKYQDNILPNPPRPTRLPYDNTIVVPQ